MVKVYIANILSSQGEGMEFGEMQHSTQDWSHERVPGSKMSAYVSKVEAKKWEDVKGMKLIGLEYLSTGIIFFL